MSRINKEVVLKIIVLLGFALFYMDILKDNSIINYVHPRIVPFAKISTVLMIITAVCLILDIRKSLIYRKSLNAYIIFAVIFIILLLGGKEKIDNVDDSNPTLEHSYIENSSSYNVEDQDNIIVDEKNFMEFLNKVQTDNNDYLNKNIEITGFIFRDDKKDIYLARNVMVCCTADMDTVGIPIRGSNIDELNDETWVKLIGNIDDADKGEIVFRVQKVIKINKPKLPYVYPY